MFNCCEFHLHNTVNQINLHLSEKLYQSIQQLGLNKEQWQHIQIKNTYDILFSRKQ